MSSEVIEAVYRYSHFFRKELMLIVSKNQVDYSGGYVNLWNTEQYASFLEEMKNKYSNSNVKNCRDHCGPGFSNVAFNDEVSNIVATSMLMEDIYKTIETDIENRFDLIHIDLCHYQGTNKERLYESKKAIEHCLNLNSKIALEIGTDENVGSMYSINSLEEIHNELNFFKDFCDPEFYVVQTGSLVKEINQIGLFNNDFLIEASKIVHESNVKNCRDHCGPGFSGSMLMEDTYKTIETDIENRFDLIHIDLCHYQGTNKERLYESKKAIEHCLNLNNEVALEIGTDENVGSMYSINSLEEIQQELDFFKSFSNPDFYVVQTGSLVMEINQMGSFNKSFLIESNKLIHDNDCNLRSVISNPRLLIGPTVN